MGLTALANVRVFAELVAKVLCGVVLLVDDILDGSGWRLRDPRRGGWSVGLIVVREVDGRMDGLVLVGDSQRGGVGSEESGGVGEV